MESYGLDLDYKIERYNPSYEMKLSFFLEFDRDKDKDDFYTSRHFNLQKNDLTFLALDSFNDILGYINARYCRFAGYDENNMILSANQPIARLMDLYVLPDYRHMGIATSLIEVLKQDYARRGIETIIAFPTPELHKSHFYQKEGIIEEQEFKSLGA